ncbi:condensin-2 complex subunit H2 [Melopsittacus undulatus]|uniref:condensin-2 complex subunit H2 n=1 Tax=Melopsittacus undulatus TaxID=13146 RepID=UPI00146CC355|nr:condensin-2 complex subunit H2 [Melopsittacus undulatus]
MPLSRGELESRFMQLLQPIRDLTKNWEVDVAAQLGEYLEELQHVCISFDNGKTTMNFMEAALLIQGSACVYSRKVEYLYSLVFQTLDYISNKKQDKLPSSLDPDGRDADATFGEGDIDEKFLSLDDIKDTSQASVDMKDHQSSPVHIVPSTPMSLVPPEDDEKRENPLLSCKGEVLASRKDFRMNVCTPHKSGAFLLELAGQSPAWPQSPGPVPAAPAGVPGSSSDHSSSRAEAPVRALSFSEEGGLEDDGAGGDDPMQEDAAVLAPGDAKHTESQRSTPRYALRERAPAQHPHTHVKELLDPWQSLDPFADSEDKPLRKGRPFLVPLGLEDMVGGKRKRKSPRKLQSFIKWFAMSYDKVSDGRRAKRNGLTFADLEILYWKQMKERVAAQKKLQPREPLQLDEEPELMEAERGAEDDEAEGDFGEHEDIEVLEEQEEGAPSPRPSNSLCYEELVRRNVELFMVESQRYVQETELSQRVRCWEERMVPLLQEQESRQALDVRGYGQALVQGCSSVGHWCSFARLVAGQPPAEVSRYLMATLQLANDYVVELAQEPGLEEALDTLRLRLLTHQQAHERFQAFRLPSACP